MKNMALETMEIKTIDYDKLVALALKYGGTNNSHYDWFKGDYKRVEGSEYLCENSLKSNYKYRGRTHFIFPSEEARDKFVEELLELEPTCQPDKYPSYDHFFGTSFYCSAEGFAAHGEKMYKDIVSHGCR